MEAINQMAKYFIIKWSGSSTQLSAQLSTQLSATNINLYLINPLLSRSTRSDAI